MDENAETLNAKEQEAGKVKLWWAKWLIIVLIVAGVVYFAARNQSPLDYLNYHAKDNLTKQDNNLKKSDVYFSPQFLDDGDDSLMLINEDIVGSP